MSSFRCLPIEPEAAHQLRTNQNDAFGNTIQRRVQHVPGAPCRVCLREAAAGDAMLLASYGLPRPLGIYWTPSPIFLHDEACEPYAREGHVPDVVRSRLVSLRSYDKDHQVLYDLGVVTEGSEVDEPLARSLADPRTAYVNIHTAKPGCLLCIVERAS
jgi:hypothetical protein